MGSAFSVYYLGPEGVTDMESIQMDTVVAKDGVINMKVTGLPFKKGQQVKVTFRAKGKNSKSKGRTRYPYSSAARLRNSPIIGMWADRADIGDSVEFARKLRERAEKRQA